MTLAWLARHRRWGAIALPLLARLYVRQRLAEISQAPAQEEVSR